MLPLYKVMVYLEKCMTIARIELNILCRRSSTEPHLAIKYDAAPKLMISTLRCHPAGYRFTSLL